MTNPVKLGGRAGEGVARRSGRDRDVMRGRTLASKRSAVHAVRAAVAPLASRFYRPGTVDTRTPSRCPTCRAPVHWQDNPHRPFCSERCRMIDLGNWAAERYRVPDDGVDDDNGSDNTPQ